MMNYIYLSATAVKDIILLLATTPSALSIAVCKVYNVLGIAHYEVFKYIQFNVTV